MKTIIFGILGLCTLLFSFCSNPEISEFTATDDNGVTYEYEVVVPLMHYVRVSPVTTASQLTGTVVIPATVYYEGTRYVVTQIAEEAFEDYTGITEVVVPGTVTTIEEEAFKGCTSLTEINTPQPLSTIEASAFEGCSSLTDFNFVASISTLGVSCFEGCSSLEEIELPTSLNTIPTRAFYGCSDAESIFISSTVLTVGAEAFAGCTGVTEMTCMAGMPPTANANSFNNMNASIPVTVPMGGLNYYRTATGWSHFSNYTGVY